MKFQKSTVINAAPEQVFEYLSDITRHPEWASHQLRIEQRTDGPVAAGARYVTVGHQFGADSRDEIVVTDVTPGKRFAFNTRTKDGGFAHAFEFQPEGTGTRLSKTFDVAEPNLKLKLLTPLFLVAAPRGLSADLTKIKAKVEAGVTRRA